MKNALILHGAGNNSQGNWFPWLKRSLENRGFKVWSPDLPNSDHPVLNDWLETIFSSKDWQFNSESILIGHSSGATFILRVLENLPKNIQVNKAILVAAFASIGTNPQFFPYKEDLVSFPFDWQKIKESASKLYFIASKNDPYQCGKDQSELLQKHLGGELVIKKDEGHFNLEKGEQYKQFPFLLELV